MVFIKQLTMMICVDARLALHPRDGEITDLVQNTSYDLESNADSKLHKIPSNSFKVKSGDELEYIKRYFHFQGVPRHQTLQPWSAVNHKQPV